MRRSVVAPWLALGLAGPGLAAEVLVNEHSTAGLQSSPDVAAAGDGSFVVAWASEPDQASVSQVWSRRYDAPGVPLADELRVDGGSGPAFAPAVARNPEGDTLVAWWAFDGFEVRGQRFDATGSATGGEFEATNPPFAGLTQVGELAVAGIFLDQFVAVWAGTHDFLRYDIFGRRIDGDGTPLGAGFTANGDGQSNHAHPAVASEPSGNYVVAWHVGARILARGFTPAGVIGAPVELSPTSDGGGVSLALDGAGRLVAVWPQGGTVQARLFDADLQPSGAAFRIDASGAASRPDVARAAEGNFVVVWERTAVPLQEVAILARHFGSSGRPRGAEVPVSEGGGLQADPAVADVGGGLSVVVWTSPASAGGDTDILAAALVDPVLFADGFE